MQKKKKKRGRLYTFCNSKNHVQYMLDNSNGMKYQKASAVIWRKPILNQIEICAMVGGLWNSIIQGLISFREKENNNWIVPIVYIFI